MNVCFKSRAQGKWKINPKRSLAAGKASVFVGFFLENLNSRSDKEMLRFCPVLTWIKYMTR